MTDHPEQRPPQVPALQDTWPPTRDELYLVMIAEHWRLEAFAHEVLRGRADRGQLDEVADRLVWLAGLLRKHQPDG